jgi:UDP-3-O-[3-hydroxymyristoyl] glucosamine N-acyltransferase
MKSIPDRWGAIWIACAVVWGLSATGSFAQPVFGPELQINRRVAGDQFDPTVEFAADGSFVVLWSSGGDLRGQRFDPAGRRDGGELGVPGWGGFYTSTSADADGDFVVVAGGWYGIGFQRFARDGSPLGSFTDLDGSWGTFYHHDVAMAPGGDFVVSWHAYSGGLRVQRFDAEGNEIGGLETASVSFDGEQSPALAMAEDSSFVVVWVGAEQNVWGRRFSATSAVGREFRVSTNTATTKSAVDVGAAPDGSFVAVWQSYGQDGDAGGIFGQRFDAAGRRLGAELRINTTTGGNQSDPSVAMSAGFDFVVAWTSQGQDGSDDGVFAQVFAAGGSRVGSEMQVNIRAEGAQSRPMVGLASRGGSGVVVWDGHSERGDLDVFGRRFASATVDADGDGHEDELDNCPSIHNPDQDDAQGDGLGDACVAPDVIIPDGVRIGPNPRIGSGTFIDTGVAIGGDAWIGERVLLSRGAAAGDRVTIGDRVFLGRRCRLGDDVTVGADTRIEADVSVGHGVSIGEQALIRRSVTIESGASIEALAVLQAGARIGEGATVEVGSRIGRGAVVLPGAIVPAGTSVPPGAVVP